MEPDSEQKQSARRRRPVIFLALFAAILAADYLLAMPQWFVTLKPVLLLGVAWNAVKLSQRG